MALNFSFDLCVFPSLSAPYQPSPVSAGHRPGRTFPPHTLTLSLGAKRPVWQRPMGGMLRTCNSAFGLTFCLKVLSTKTSTY